MEDKAKAELAQFETERMTVRESRISKNRQVRRRGFFNQTCASAIGSKQKLTSSRHYPHLLLQEEQATMEAIEHDIETPNSWVRGAYNNKSSYDFFIFISVSPSLSPFFVFFFLLLVLPLNGPPLSPTAPKRQSRTWCSSSRMDRQWNQKKRKQT